MKKETVNVNWSDEDHVWIGGKQFVSLNRFQELQNDSSKELDNYIKKTEELTSENEALKFLLRDVLNESETDYVEPSDLIEIDIINDIVKQAIIHGADCGGSYDNNRENLTNAMNRWISLRKLHGKLIVQEVTCDDGWIVLKIVPTH